MAVTENVTLEPAVTDWLKGCTEIPGGTFTVKAALDEMIEPAILVMTTELPALAGCTFVSVKVLAVAPAIGPEVVCH